jgi:hypothetical protein
MNLIGRWLSQPAADPKPSIIPPSSIGDEITAEDQLMSKCGIRAWIDAEGYIYSTPPPRSEAAIVVTQAEREPIETFCRSVQRYWIPCTVRTLAQRWQRTEILGLEEGARAIKEFGLSRTQIRRGQAETFKQHLLHPRRRLTRAHTILGI